MKVTDAAKAVVAAPARLTFGFLAGLRYPFRGARFVYIEHPSLARFWIFPILITLVALVGVWTVVGEYHVVLLDMLWESPTGDGFLDKVLRWLHAIVDFIVTLLLGLFGLFLVAALTSVFAAPFNDALSEEVERLVTGVKGPPFSLRVILRDLVRTVLIELGKLGIYIGVMGPLFIAQFIIPGVGALIYSVFGFCFTALYFAVDYVDWPASRRNRGVRYRMGFVRRRFTTMLGFGTGVWVFLFIPLVNLLFMPAAVAGGTLLFLDLDPQSPTGGGDASGMGEGAHAGGRAQDALDAP